MSASSVVAGTVTCWLQSTQAKPGTWLVSSMKLLLPVLTVGVRGLTCSVTVPARAATASGSTLTFGSRQNSRRRKRAKSGCGSTASTRAPSADQHRDRLPTWAPISKHKVPGRTNGA